MTEPWSKLKYHYDTLLKGVKEWIVELKMLVQIVRQLAQIVDKIGEERKIEDMLAAQLSSIPVEALQFDTTEVQ